jgi:hypothetical protein
MKQIIFSKHALEQLADRGTFQEEVKFVIQQGEQIPAKKGRIAFRKNFVFKLTWKEKYYEIKQVIPIVKEEANKYIVITVYVFYFGGR